MCLLGKSQEWNGEKVYNDYRQLLDDPKVDAVEVIVPHNLHAEIGVVALEAGKPLSMQKPMAMSVEECDALIDA